MAWTCSVPLLIRFALADKAQAKEEMGVPVLAFCCFLPRRSSELGMEVSSPRRLLSAPPALPSSFLGVDVAVPFPVRVSVSTAQLML